MKLIFILLLLLKSISCQAFQVYDVETMPEHRTQAYSTGPYKRIVIFSAPRTGSSLVYNIFKFLFEKDSCLSDHHYLITDRVVLKTHRPDQINQIEKNGTLYIFTIRHPFDASKSTYRITTRQILDNKAFAKELVQRQRNCLLISKKMEKDGHRIIRLKYENFVHDLDFIFDSIENIFSLSINPEDKNLMRAGYCKENIYACTQYLKDFDEYLPISGFHGRHVALRKYSPPEDFLYWLNVYLADAMHLFQAYGY
jgi:hypothetical protein